MTGSGRRWLELSVRSPSAGERAPLLAEALLELGGRAIEERAGWYVTYVDAPSDTAAFEAEALMALVRQTGLADVELRVAVQEHQDWAERWKRGLTVRRVGERIVVRPSWLPPPELGRDDVVIVLDPGMAFGTAEHGTTRGCLRLLETVVAPGQRLLDVGAGSGILSVAAARLGADEVTAIEGDPLACEAMAENVARNGVADRVRVEERWADVPSLDVREVDGVVANIESGVLLPLASGLVGAVSPGGWLIVSGILAGEWQAVRARFVAEGVTPVASDEDEGWVSGLFRRPA